MYAFQQRRLRQINTVHGQITDSPKLQEYLLKKTGGSCNFMKHLPRYSIESCPTTVRKRAFRITRAVQFLKIESNRKFPKSNRIKNE